MIVFVETTETGSGVECARWSKRNNLRSVLLTSNREQYRASTIEHFDEVYQVNTRSVEELEKKILQVKSDRPSNSLAVLTTNDFYVLETALVAQKLELVGIGEKAAQCCHSKRVLREVLYDSGLGKLNPDFNVVSEETLSTREVHFPRIVKPIDGNDSVGVRLLRSKDDVDEYLSWVLDNRTDATGRSFARKFLLEEYISGPEFSVEIAIMKDSTPIFLGAFEKLEMSSEKNNMTKVACVFPYKGADVKCLIQAGTETLRAIDAGPGVYDIDCRFDCLGNVKILEINGRLVGDQMASHLMPIATGVNICGLAVKIALGCERFTMPPLENKYVAIWRVFSPETGKLTMLGELDDVYTSSEDVLVTYFKNDGDHVTHTSSNQDVIASVIVSDDSKNEAVVLAIKIAEDIKQLFTVHDVK
jgi:biotin carboxylase